MFGTGFLPTDEVNIYVTDHDELYLVGTSEASLAAFHAGEILDEGDLPIRYAGYSTCFRQEAGTYGKDMGGMFRLHQFDKVEMFSFTRPEDSWDEHEFMVADPGGDPRQPRVPVPDRRTRGGRSRRCRGEEVRPGGLAPGPGGIARSRHVRTTPTTGRAGRRPGCAAASGGTVDAAHVERCATAIGRTLIAILENNQRADGGVEAPEGVAPYLPESVRELTPSG